VREIVAEVYGGNVAIIRGHERVVYLGNGDWRPLAYRRND
jgi:hypothetical protein